MFVVSCQVAILVSERNIGRLLSLTLAMDSAEAAKPFHLVSIDVKGPLKTSSNGNRFIIAAIDYFTKLVEVRATNNYTAATTAEFILENIIYRHGAPAHILSDQGQNFESKIVAELCKRHRITKLRSSPYHPSGDGAVEREIRSLSESLRAEMLHDPLNWDRRLPAIAQARNTTVHDATGLTPFELVYARPFMDYSRPPLELSDLQTYPKFRQEVEASRKLIETSAQANLLRAHWHQNKVTAKRVKSVPILDLGDLVLLDSKVRTKSDPFYNGPFKIIGIRGLVNFILMCNGKPKTVHVNRLVKYNSLEKPNSEAVTTTSLEILFNFY